HLVNGIVHGCGDEVLEHLAVLTDHGRLDLHAAGLVPAAHGHFHHAAAGLADHLQRCDLLLDLLHVGLHGLRLLHQIVEVAFHWFSWRKLACGRFRSLCWIALPSASHKTARSDFGRPPAGPERGEAHDGPSNGGLGPLTLIPVVYFRGRMVSGTGVAPKRSRKPWTPGSDSKARRADSASSCEALWSACAGVSTCGATAVNSSRIGSP